jgi:DNA-binding Lrp family transcriptional regulator
MQTRECCDREYRNLDQQFANIFRRISDTEALIILKAMAISESYDTSSSIIMARLGLTPKQYHSRMKKLMSAGLIDRIDGRYHATCLGVVFFTWYGKIETATKYYWKLKAIDSIIGMSIGKKKIPERELKRIIETLIQNQEMKNILALTENVCEN